MVTARGHDYARPVSAMREYLGQMGQAPWRGPEAPLPPVVLAALGPRMVALAAERTAGAYPYFTTAKHIRLVREQMGPEPFLAADLPVVLAPERAEARSIGDAHMNVPTCGRTTTETTCFASAGSPKTSRAAGVR